LWNELQRWPTRWDVSQAASTLIRSQSYLVLNTGRRGYDPACERSAIQEPVV